MLDTTVPFWTGDTAVTVPPFGGGGSGDGGGDTAVTVPTFGGCGRGSGNTAVTVPTFGGSGVGDKSVLPCFGRIVDDLAVVIIVETTILPTKEIELF